MIQSDDEKIFEEAKNIIQSCRNEAAKRLIGQSDVIDAIIMAFIAGGHVLLEGAPGLAKTLAIKTFSEIAGLDFKRIQFTPDLLPADVTGTLIYEQAKGSFSVRKGPDFANIVLADEINRSPSKVQSAMLEAMEEKQVTIGEKTYTLPEPFFVLATQNPIEQEGTYNLPEAELDRFLIKVNVSYPSIQEEIKIISTMGKASKIPVEKVLDSSSIDLLRSALEKVVADQKIIEYIAKIISVTRSGKKSNEHDITRYISFGSSPRGGISLLLCAKVHAIFEGRSFVIPEDVKKVAVNVLQHRLVLSYEASADEISSEQIIQQILDCVPLP